MEDNSGLIVLNEDGLKDLCEKAEETFTGFEKDVKSFMTKEKAEYVKSLRVDGYTWRAIAAECYEKWGGDWFPHSNQLMGMALCEEAVKYFENEPGFDKEDW